MKREVNHILIEDAKDYDTFIRKIVPHYDELEDVVVECLPFKKYDAFTVVDLGVGTGETSKRILINYPNAEILGVDKVPEVIENAKRRLASYSDRISFIKKDLTNFNFPKSCDVVVSVLAFHHLTHAQKKRLYKKIYQNLNPNGILIMGDLVTFENPKKDTNTKEDWIRYMLQQFKDQAYVDYLMEVHEREMTPSSLESQIEFLKKIGFKNPVKIWEHMNYAVFKGRK